MRASRLEIVLALFASCLAITSAVLIFILFSINTEVGNPAVVPTASVSTAIAQPERSYSYTYFVFDSNLRIVCIHGNYPEEFTCLQLNKQDFETWLRDYMGVER